jgi:hypothetical protein
MSIPKIEIEKELRADQHIYRCANCMTNNRVKFKIRLFERRQQEDPVTMYVCVRCLVSLSYSFLGVKRTGK